MRTSNRVKSIFALTAVLGFLTLALCLRAQEPRAVRIGVPQDWSTRHLVFTGGASPQMMAEAAKDPRSWISWVHRTAPLWKNARMLDTDPSSDRALPQLPIQAPIRFRSRIDWSLSLGGTGGMPVAETPAKYSFNANMAPDCVNDFVVFVINATPNAGSQANILAVNNLYSGPPPNTCGANPNFMWSYAVGNGSIVLSPVLSLDGTKVAFIEASSPNPTFNVLKWVTGQGTNATTGAVAPGSGGSSVTSLNYTNTTVTGCTASPTSNSNSSAFVDYAHNVAYVGANNGILYRIKNVFTGTPTLDYCITVKTGASLTSPVYDFASGKVFISDGQSVYGFIPGTTSFTAAGSIQVAGTAGSIVLSPIVDSTNGFLYVFASHNNSNTNVIVSQIPVSLVSHVDAAIGPFFTGQFILDGDFDAKYYNNGPTNGSLYACGTQTGASTKPSLYTLSFQASGIMNTTPAMSNNVNINSAANPAGTCSPLLEFFNGTTDRLFAGVGRQGATTGANLVSMWVISNRITSNTTLPSATATNELGGTSGFAVDNDSPLPQASSIYFGTMAKGANSPCGANLYCAVKLTQSGLQ